MSLFVWKWFPLIEGQSSDAPVSNCKIKYNIYHNGVGIFQLYLSVGTSCLIYKLYQTPKSPGSLAGSQGSF